MKVSEDRFFVRNLSCPITVMQFYLVYNGPLSGAGNKAKPEEICHIRDQLHPQLKELWETHVALKRLRRTAVVAREPQGFLADLDSPFYPERDPARPLQDGFVDLCEPIQQEGKIYIPLVRKSLDLVCSLDILFLRQEDPGALVLQGGDLDNRIKTLFDALRIPNVDMQRDYPQAQDETYCLLESDTLISGFNVSIGRLLVAKAGKRKNQVHLVIEVTVMVLKLGAWNICLMGDI